MISPRKPRGRPFLPGNKMSRGRAPSVAAQNAALTHDGAQIVEMFQRYASGAERCSARDRIEAGKWLADRLWGRAVETSVQVMASQDRAAVGALALSTAALCDLYTRLQGMAGLAPGEPRREESVVESAGYVIDPPSTATSPPFSETRALVAETVPPAPTPPPRTGAKGPRRQRAGAPPK